MHDDKTRKRGQRKQAEDAPKEAGERIAKRLSRAGVASRREAEALIADGRVKVNGKVLDTPALTVTDADRIEIDGQPIPVVERTRLFLFHKPAGVVTTSRDPEGRRTVFDVLPAELPRLMTIGRLDINTEGLLLLTNDGGLARVLELPQTGWLRRYRVRVHGSVDEKALAGLKDGIAVDGVFYGAVEAALERVQGTNAWLTVGLREGKNREVKNIMAALGLEVTRLIRVSFGPFQLAELPEGEVREIKGRMLRDQLGPRLIEEAGANFDAPVADAQPATSRPARRDDAPVRPARAPMQEEAGGLIRNRRRDRDDKRERALSRLSTSAPAGGRGRGPAREKAGRDKGGEDERARERPGVRKSNVWMAPGARPVSRDEAETGGEEKVTKVARKPGDRKARHDAAAQRYRPGKAERTAAGGDGPKREWKPRGEEAGTDRPKREWKPRPEGEERPKREFKPRGDGPKREWKPRAEGTGTDRPKREWKPRPEGEERPKRDFKPRGDGPKREWKPRGEETGTDRPKREWKPRPEGEERPKRDFKPRGDGPKREWKPRAEGTGTDRPKRDWKAKPPRAGKAERSQARATGTEAPREYRPAPKREGAGDRPPRASSGKPGGRPRGDRPGGPKPFGGKPGGTGPRKGPPPGGKPRGGKKS